MVGRVLLTDSNFSTKPRENRFSSKPGRFPFSFVIFFTKSQKVDLERLFLALLAMI
jgi:hypothetical protein